MAESTPVAERSPAELVEIYIKLRDAKKAAQDEFKKSIERTNLGMEKLEAILLAKLQELGVDSLSAKGIGTVYRNTETSASVRDKAAFRDFVMQNDNWEVADLRANKVVVEAMLKQGIEVPGVNFTTMHTVGVRRS